MQIRAENISPGAIGMQVAAALRHLERELKAGALVKRVPKGRVITDGRLAQAVRLRGGARSAGRAMAACPNALGIPWHRVLDAGGRILIQAWIYGPPNSPSIWKARTSLRAKLARRLHK